MLKNAVELADRRRVEPERISADPRVPDGPDTTDDLENRWTPVAFTLALTDDEGEA